MVYAGSVCDHLQNLSSTETDKVLDELKKACNKNGEDKKDKEYLKFPTVSSSPCCGAYSD